MNVLVCNDGSSTLKLSLFEAANERLLARRPTE
jgi:acetate kinase